MARHDAFFACAPGVEALLCDELRELGLSVKQIEGGADAQLTELELIRAAYSVGLATHVRVRVGRGPAKSMDRWSQDIDWEAYATGVANVRDAGVGESQCKKLQSRLPNRGEEAWTVLARRVDDEVELSIDVAGEPLYRRGYRRGTGKAPLRSDLARALLKLSGWTPGDTLTDAFCGSGTIIAEALLLATKAPPAFLRQLACSRWRDFQNSDVEDLIETLRSPEATEAPTLLASDRDEGAVGVASENLKRVTDGLGLPAIAVQCAAFRTATHHSKGGWLISNPPHGGRVGKMNTLRNLYQSIGHQASKGDMKLALLVADRKMAYATGHRLKSALFTRHSGRKIWVMVPEEAV